LTILEDVMREGSEKFHQKEDRGKMPGNSGRKLFSRGHNQWGEDQGGREGQELAEKTRTRKEGSTCRKMRREREGLSGGQCHRGGGGGFGLDGEGEMGEGGGGKGGRNE